MRLTAAVVSCAALPAGTISYIVYVDETPSAGHAFYIGLNSSHRDPNDCPKNLDGAGLKCSLDYSLINNVPTVKLPGNVQGGVGRQIQLGDVRILEPHPEFLNEPNSDVIRFVNTGGGVAGGADALQFYSGPDDSDIDGSTDLKLPTVSTDVCTDHDLNAMRRSVGCGELDLGTLGGANTPPVPVIGSDGKDVFGKRLSGRWGYYYIADINKFNDPVTGNPQKVVDPGASVNGTPGDGLIAYVFVSDADQLTSKSTKSAHFDASTSRLSFTSDSVIDAGSAGDPLVGADVNNPSFLLQGTTPDGQELFSPVGGGEFTLGLGACTYMRATIRSLTYSPSANTFSAQFSSISAAGVDPTSPLYDPSLGCIDSPFLQYLDSVFNPNSVLFDPDGSLYISYQPDSNFFAATAGFTDSAESSFTNIVFVTDAPEPRMTLLEAAVLVWFTMAACRKRLLLCMISRADAQIRPQPR